jgi:beta-glucosidase
VEYRESLYVGYRFFETVGKPVLFPFGHGLSYTAFAYENLHLSASAIKDDGHLTVEVTVRNTGSLAGKEVVQLYVSPVAPTAFRPKMELKSFKKVHLQPGEAKQVTLTLDSRAFAHFSTASNDWQVESGAYRILVGASAHQIHLEGEVQVTSTQPELPIPERDRLPAYANFPAAAQVSQADFEALLGYPLPVNTLIKDEPATINTPIADMRKSLVVSQLQKTMQKQVDVIIGNDPDSPNAQMVQTVLGEAPLRTLLLFGGGAISRGLVDGLLLMINRKYVKGLSQVLKSRKRGKS